MPIMRGQKLQGKQYNTKQTIKNKKLNLHAITCKFFVRLLYKLYSLD